MSNAFPTVPLTGLGSLRTDARCQERSLRLTICAGQDAGKVFDFGKAELVVGRGLKADAQLSDQAVSQFHCSLKLTADGVQVRDLFSKNGSWLSGIRLEQATVPLGTVLSLGHSMVRVDLGVVAANPVERQISFGRLVGQSECMQRLYAKLGKLAPTALSVLIEGETGTGKEEIARILHEQSPRRKAPWIVVDCTNLPESLATSLLFGHEKGAFSDASQKRIGLFAAANGGDIFLDEIGELPASVQAALLRAVQQREVLPLGACHPLPIDVRIFCATKRDLRAMVNQGRFREDLYYRLAEANVYAPALRERREDIPLLIEHFLKLIPGSVRAARALEPAVLEQLTHAEYEGNVRELRATVLRLAQMADAAAVTLADLAMDRLSAGLRSTPAGSRRPRASVPAASADGDLGLYHDERQTALDEFEKSYCERLMSRANQNLSRAAALAGIERQNLRALLRKHGLYRPPARND